MGRRLRRWKPGWRLWRRPLLIQDLVPSPYDNPLSLQIIQEADDHRGFLLISFSPPRAWLAPFSYHALPMFQNLLRLIHSVLFVLYIPPLTNVRFLTTSSVLAQGPKNMKCAF